jgi:glutamate-1-semialdehyde 2,1-aminomutase
MGERLRVRLRDVISARKLPAQITGESSLFRFVMVSRPLKSYRDTVEPGVAERTNRLFMALLDAGLMINNNGLACLSTPMGEAELDHIESAVDRALSSLQEG